MATSWAWDRDAVLAAVDLEELADELLGERRGSARSPTWRCPNPEHPQTGRTPPVTIRSFGDPAGDGDGDQRWKCHGCGLGGTAIDLVVWAKGVGVGDAFRLLAGRTGPTTSSPVRHVRRNRERPRAAGRHPPLGSAVPLPRPVQALKSYVAACSEILWRPGGAAVRRWLEEVRGIPAGVLRVNRVGADLGWRRQPRPDGMAKVWAAVVLPVLVDGKPTYVQLRVLGDPGRRLPKYMNPPSELAPNPKVGFFEVAGQSSFPFDRRELIVAEGAMDALSAAAGGYRAAGVLSSSYADPVAARVLAARPEKLIVAFDPDPAGRRGAEELVRLLVAHGRDPGVMVLRRGDLNENLIRSGDWPAELAGRVQHAVVRGPRPPPQGLGRSLV